MRYLVCADIHLNVNRRFEDTLDALKQIHQLIFKHKVDKVIILGDVYTSRRPHSKEKTVFQKWIHSIVRPNLSDDEICNMSDEEVEKEYNRRVEVLIVKGNHDEYPDGTHSYSEFTELKIPNVEIRDNPTFEGNFFLGHLLIAEAKMGPEDYQSLSCQSVVDLIQKYPSPLRSGVPCKAYLLGDVHKAQTIQKDPLVIYAGSINRVDFGERYDEKSVLLIDDMDEYPKFKCKRIVLKSRSMIQLDIFPPEIMALQDGNEIDIEDVNDAIVKVIIHGSPAEIKMVDEKELRETYEPRVKEFTIQYNVTKETVARDKRVNENITPQNALELYLERLDLSNEEKQGILTLSQEIVDAES